MTTREYFQTVLDAHLSDDMDKASVELIEKLDARNEKRKSADSKAKRESADRRQAVYAELGASPIFADTIAESTGLSVGQVRSALTALVKDGKADKVAVKVEKTKKMAYTLHFEG